MVARTVEALGGLKIVVAAAGISHAHYGEEGQPEMTFDNKVLRELAQGDERQPRRRISYLAPRRRDDRGGQRRSHH